jgi:low temperature requirement protein LtrA
MLCQFGAPIEGGGRTRRPLSGLAVQERRRGVVWSLEVDQERRDPHPRAWQPTTRPGGLFDQYDICVTDPPDTRTRFRRWFWRPPRAHGETIPDRRVSALELLYDLVFVAVISQAAHHLADDVAATSVLEFAIVFGLIWIAWVNGSLYVELHGEADGRTRSIVFVQIGILALLAVFTADATGDGGAGFALVYAAFLAFISVLWFLVRQRDRLVRPEFLSATGRYTVAMALLAVIIFVSAFVAPKPRLIVWAGAIVAWLGLMQFQARGRIGLERGIIPTHSLVERFGLFTIIVLGEVVFGVVEGLSVADRDLKTFVTGMLALGLGFGFWWIYFDVVGDRLPKGDGRSLANWTLSHLPITLAIAAGGAAMVSLIAHANDPQTPAWTAYLLSGAVALGLLAEIITTRALADGDRLTAVYGPLRRVMLVGAVAAVVVGYAQPAPWLLALLLGGVMSALWFFTVATFLRAGAWTEEVGT